MATPIRTPDRPPSARLPEGLNAAQMAAVAEAIREMSVQLRLRQWCIEKAVETDAHDRVAMAREMFNFITEQPVVIESEEA